MHSSTYQLQVIKKNLQYNKKLLPLKLFLCECSYIGTSSININSSQNANDKKLNPIFFFVHAYVQLQPKPAMSQGTTICLVVLNLNICKPTI